MGAILNVCITLVVGSKKFCNGVLLFIVIMSITLGMLLLLQVSFYEIFYSS